MSTHADTSQVPPPDASLPQAPGRQKQLSDIPESLLESVYSSVPRRVAAVIKAEGWYTKY